MTIKDITDNTTVSKTILTLIPAIILLRIRSLFMLFVLIYACSGLGGSWRLLITSKSCSRSAFLRFASDLIFWNVWVDRTKLIVKRLVHVIKEVLYRTGRQVIRNASASLLLKELTPDIVDRLRDGSSPPADRRWMAASELNTCWHVRPKIYLKAL